MAPKQPMEYVYFVYQGQTYLAQKMPQMTQPIPEVKAVIPEPVMPPQPEQQQPSIDVLKAAMALMSIRRDAVRAM